MARRFVDLSVALKAGIASDPPPLLPKIEYMGHDEGAKEFEQMAGVPVDKQLEGKGCASERCQTPPIPVRILTRLGIITRR